LTKSLTIVLFLYRVNHNVSRRTLVAPRSCLEKVRLILVNVGHVRIPAFVLKAGLLHLNEQQPAFRAKPPPFKLITCSLNK